MITGLQQVSVSSCENAVFRNATGWRSLGQGFVFEKRRAMHDPFLGNYNFTLIIQELLIYGKYKNMLYIGYACLRK